MAVSIYPMAFRGRAGGRTRWAAIRRGGKKCSKNEGDKLGIQASHDFWGKAKMRSTRGTDNPRYVDQNVRPTRPGQLSLPNNQFIQEHYVRLCVGHRGEKFWTNEGTPTPRLPMWSLHWLTLDYTEQITTSAWPATARTSDSTQQSTTVSKTNVLLYRYCIGVM